MSGIEKQWMNSGRSWSTIKTKSILIFKENIFYLEIKKQYDSSTKPHHIELYVRFKILGNKFFIFVYRSIFKMVTKCVITGTDYQMRTSDMCFPYTILNGSKLTKQGPQILY